MAQHNLSTVVGFEFTCTVRKRGFWVATLAIPVVIAIVFALSFASSTSNSDSEDAQAEAELSFAYTDASGTIPGELAAAYGGREAADAEAAIEQVRTGGLDAYFAYPLDPAAEPIEVTGTDRGLFDNGAYAAVAESLLTTAARQQIGDPDLAVCAVGAVQILVFLTPVLIGCAFFRDRLDIPEVDLTSVRLDPGTMLAGSLLLIGGFVLFTGVLVAIGAVMPTAKDAGVVFGPLIGLMFVPFYAISLIISDPGALIVQVFTYFPLTAPVTAMLRNALGTLDALTAGVVIAELFVLGVLVLRVAVQLFRYGSIAYTDKLGPRVVLRRKGAAAGK